MKIRTHIAKFTLFGLIAASVLSPFAARASQVTNRSVTLGSSGASAVTTNIVSFTIPTAGTVGSIEFLYCSTAYGACTKPAGLSSTAATLTAQSGATGFSMVNANDGLPYLTRAAASVAANTAVSYTLGNITNPSASNTEFYVRMETFVSTDATGTPVDTGVTAVSTANQITVSGIMPESLIFCVGSAGTDCGNITGTSINLGVFSPSTTSTGTSVMSASTNAGFGYSITVNAGAFSSGANTIPSMGTQTANSSACSPSCTSTPGISQFGTNVRGNSSPGIGSEVSGSGSGTGNGGYNSVNSFRFLTGDSLASATGPTKSNLFTNSYVVNVGGDQAAGTYSSTMTYICTATF